MERYPRRPAPSLHPRGEPRRLVRTRLSTGNQEVTGNSWLRSANSPSQLSEPMCSVLFFMTIVPSRNDLDAVL